MAYSLTRVEDMGPAPRRTSIRGFGQSAAFSLGGTVVPGVVVGGTLWTSRIDPVFVEGGKTVSPDDDSVKVTMLRAGPFLDWYPDPRRGFHAESALALAVAVETDVRGRGVDPSGVGVAVSLGGGYEWFVGDEVSVGVIARGTLAGMVRAPPDGAERLLAFLPELLLSATYH